MQELDRPWTETPFLFQGFRIRSPEEIGALREHCDHLYVDRVQSIDVPDTHWFAIDTPPSLASRVKGIAGASCKTGIYADTVPVALVLETARNIYSKSYGLVQDMSTALYAENGYRI